MKEVCKLGITALTWAVQHQYVSAPPFTVRQRASIPSTLVPASIFT